MTQPTPSPSSSASATPVPTLDQAGRERVAAAVAAEHAAIYAYGVLGPRLTRTHVAAARAAEAEHRRRRDAFSRVLAKDVPPASAAYQTGVVTDATAALKLAAQVEERVTAAYRSALAATEGEARRMVLAGMVDAATRAATWRKAIGEGSVTSAFPGRP